MHLKRNSQHVLFLFAGDIGSRLLAFLATIYMARILGKHDFGAISLALTLLNYALLLGNSGLNLFGIREIAAREQGLDAFTGKLTGLRVLISAAVCALSWIAAGMYFSDPVMLQMMRIYLLALFPAALLPDWFFQARRQMGALTAGRIAGMAVYLLMVLLLVQHSGDLRETAIAFVCGGVAQGALQFWLYFRSGRRLAWRGEKMSAGHMLKSALVMGIAFLASQMVLQFPAIYLGWKAGMAEIGVFSAAFKLIVLLLVFDRVFYTLFYPAISRQARQSSEKLPATINSLLRIVATFALIASVTALVFAAPAVDLLFGENYRDSVPLFRLLSGYFVLTILNSVAGYSLLGMGEEKRFTAAFLIATVVFFIAVVIIPPEHPIIGIISALLLYQLSALLLLSLDLVRRIRLRWQRGILPALVLWPLALAVVWLQPDSMFNGLLLPAVLLLAPLATGLGKSDIDFLRDLFL